MLNRTYIPDEKRLVRRLLLLHNGNVPIVHHLTGFLDAPSTTGADSGTTTTSSTPMHWRMQNRVSREIVVGED